MTNIKTKLLGRIAVAAAISLGLAASAVAIASASPDGHHSSSHFSSLSAWPTNRVEGTVSSYTAGTSISILSKGSTTPTTYTLTSGTTITGLGTGDTLASPDRVVLELSTTTPVTVTAIKVCAPKPVWVEGTVSSYTAGTSISILSKGSTTPTTYTLTSGTTITGLGTGDTLASPDRVVLELSTTTSVTVTAIKVLGSCKGGFGGFGHGHSHGHGFNHFGRNGANSQHGNFRR